MRKINDFAKLRYLYGTHGVTNSFIVNRKKVYESRSGVMTEEGDIEIEEWTARIKQVIESHGEQEITDRLIEYVQQLPWARDESIKDIEIYALKLHADRIFENPMWVGYKDFHGIKNDVQAFWEPEEQQGSLFETIC